ncbi:MAG TPA: polysaccharide biosynthesis/export family protein [Terriglobales bacterium]|nr:polysaccharide biosynthesis/export family protein [Terriglobales bacterium]
MRMRITKIGFGRLILILVFVLTATCALAQTESVPGSPVAPGGKAHDNSYVIGVDDVLAISVWKEPEVSKTVPVRSDGKISLPLAGEVQASGQTPVQLEQQLTAKLKSYISEPEVTVIVEKINSEKFNILGMVAKPGSFPLTSASTILDAIALSGGFRDFAKQKSIYVLRKNPDGTESRLPFNYKKVIKGKNMTQNIKLQSGDTIVVP